MRVNYSVYDDTLSFAGNEKCYNFAIHNIEFNDDFMSESSYRPKLGSAAIDSGTTPSDVAFIDYDIEEKTRSAGSSVDIGVYEYNPDERSVVASLEKIDRKQDHTKQLPVEHFYVRYATNSVDDVITIEKDGHWFDLNYRDNQEGYISISLLPKDDLLYGSYSGSVKITLAYYSNLLPPYPWQEYPQPDPENPWDYPMPYPSSQPQIPLQPTLSNSLYPPETIEIVIPYTLLLNREIYVPSECPSLQTAITKAIDGDTIVVEDGIYTGKENTITDLAGKSLTIVSESNDPRKTIFDFSYQYSLLDVSRLDVENLCFKGIGFRNSSQDAPFFDGRNIRQTTLNKCNFNNIKWFNSAYSNPNLNTVMQAFYLRNALITDCNFENISGIIANGEVVLADSVFNNCQSPLALHGGSANVKLCEFNNGKGGIGGVWAKFRIEQCSYVGNYVMFGSGLVPLGFSSDTQVSKCLFAGNLCDGALIFNSSDLQLTNCTFTNNHIITNHAYSSLIWSNTSGTKTSVSNSIFHNNTSSYSIVIDGDYDISLSVNYCNIDPLKVCGYYWENDEGIFKPITDIGVGNINTDPLFVRNGFWGFENEEDYSTYVWHNGDYHLKSNGWSWNDDYGLWDYHRQTSECIDAGDPTESLGEELPKVADSDIWSENIRINMGCYGGTKTASIPPVGWQLLSDFNNDRIVNNLDFIHIAESWCQTEPFGDISRDGITDSADLLLLLEQWLSEAKSL